MQQMGLQELAAFNTMAQHEIAETVARLAQETGLQPAQVATCVARAAMRQMFQANRDAGSPNSEKALEAYAFGLAAAGRHL